MEGKRLTWEEIRKQYPKQWVAVCDVERDEDDYLLSGVVFHNHQNKDVFLSGLDAVRDRLGLNSQCISQRFTGTFKPLPFTVEFLDEPVKRESPREIQT